MTRKEEAHELIDKFINLEGHIEGHIEGQCKNPLNTLFISQAKKCALICVDELISCLPSVNGRPPNYQDVDKYTSEYWQEVKPEIEKLYKYL